MGHSMAQYILVMRHAHRQDDADDSWLAAEAARPDGRPWDPPLSSLGLSQATEAASQLASWELITNCRIVAVVTSPFQRCLQTATAVCRQLGLRQLHVGWAVSEALSRVKDTPTGPLCDWMWPSSAVSREPGSGKGMRVEEYLATLGAVVHAEASDGRDENGSDSSGRRSRYRRVEGHTLLKGLGVSVLPPPEITARSQLASPVSDTAGGSASARDSSERLRPEPAAASGSEGRAAGTSASLTPEAASADMSGTPAQVALIAQAFSAPAPAPNNVGGEMDLGRCVHDRRQQTATDSHDLHELAPATPGCHAPQHESVRQTGTSAPAQPEQLHGNQNLTHGAPEPPTATEPAAVLPAVSVATDVIPFMPCSPETMEEAYARYRAVFRCLMTPVGAGVIRGPQSDRRTPNASADEGVVSDAEAPHAGMHLGAASWRALWASCPRSPSLDVPADKEGAAAKSGLGKLGASSTGTATSQDDSGAGDISSVRTSGGGSTELKAVGNPGGSPFKAVHEGGVVELPKGPESLRAELGGGGGRPLGLRASQADLEESNQADEDPPSQRASQGCLRTAVLVVTHGDAVACAAMTVAPHVLVYEVRPTGFVVIAAEGNRPTNTGDGGGLTAGWELIPDTHGERGVQWMSLLEE